MSIEPRSAQFSEIKMKIADKKTIEEREKPSNERWAVVLFSVPFVPVWMLFQAGSLSKFSSNRTSAYLGCFALGLAMLLNQFTAAVIIATLTPDLPALFFLLQLPGTWWGVRIFATHFMPLARARIAWE